MNQKIGQLSIKPASAAQMPHSCLAKDSCEINMVTLQEMGFSSFLQMSNARILYCLELENKTKGLQNLSIP
jgi:hypothetical protein